MTDPVPFDCSASAVLDRLKEKLSIASDSRLAIRLGGCRTNVPKWRHRNSVPYAHILRVCAEEGIDADWILIGRWSPWQPGEVKP